MPPRTGIMKSVYGNRVLSSPLWWARSWRLRSTVRRFAETVDVVSPRRDPPGDPAKPIVLALCRNGEHFIPAFLDHYRSRGFDDFVILDNGSTDQTLAMLGEASDVTVLATDAPYKVYQRAMQRYMVDTYGRDRWSLLLDIDELFDFPGSDRIGIVDFLAYLESRGFDAVVAHQLDMFGDVDLTEPARTIRPEEYPYYALDGIQRLPFALVLERRIGSRVSNRNDQSFLVGGTRKLVMGAKSWLTKAPLVLNRKPLIPTIETHFVGRACLADVSCVLYHYKLVAGLSAQVAEANRRQHYQNMASYEKAQSAIDDGSLRVIRMEGQKRLDSIRDLYSNFLDVPDEYEAFIAERRAAK